MAYLITFLNDFITILSEMAPYLLIGFFFAGILHAFMPKQKIERYFNGSPLKSSIYASLFGVPLPLCSCGVIPTGAALYRNGASKGGTVSFLISTPQTGVDSILATFSLLGLPFAIIRPLASLVTGITGGLITSKIDKSEIPKPIDTATEQKNKPFNKRVIEVFKYGFVDFIQDISKWLVIGLVLAALISALIPDDFFSLINLAPIWQMSLILVVSIPLYICATGTIPLAAILILKGLNPGAAFVLLMAGPATNAATITMIGNVLGRKSLFAYLGTIIIGALMFGFIIDYALPLEWFTQTINPHATHIHGGGIPWWQMVSGIIMVGLIVNGYIQRYISNKASAVVDKKPTQVSTNASFKVHTTQASSIATNTNTPSFSAASFKMIDTKTIKVHGMTCNHCKSNVETNLEKLGFITSAKVNLGDKTVTLEGENINLETVRETITSLGYINK